MLDDRDFDRLGEIDQAHCDEADRRWKERDEFPAIADPAYEERETILDYLTRNGLDNDEAVEIALRSPLAEARAFALRIAA